MLVLDPGDFGTDSFIQINSNNWCPIFVFRPASSAALLFTARRHTDTAKPHNQVREKDENFDNLWLFKLTCVLNNQNQRGIFFTLWCTTPERSIHTQLRNRLLALGSAQCYFWWFSRFFSFSCRSCHMPPLVYLLFTVLHSWKLCAVKNYETGTAATTIATTTNNIILRLHALHILSVTYHGSCCIWMPKK